MAEGEAALACRRQTQARGAQITEEQKAKILALASDFPRLWRDPKTTDRERKRMARLLLEDVTLQRGHDLFIQMRFNLRMVNQLRRKYKLKSRRRRLREQGWLTVHELAPLLDCPSGLVNHWRQAGLLAAVHFSDKMIGSIKNQTKP